MESVVKKILVTEEQIDEACKRLGKQITIDYADKGNFILLGLLKGCIPFLSDLMKEIKLPLIAEFMDVTSYHGGIESTGDIRIRMDLGTSVKDKHVLICEDIVDTGRTLDTVMKLLYHRGAASVEVVTLLDKPGGRVIPLNCKYIGHTIPTEFVIGYGLDYDELYRNIPYVAVLKESVYSKE